MTHSLEHGRLLLGKAHEDLYVLERLVDDPKAPETAVGFHAQQAVEKCLKAVLSSRAIHYPRTHDIKTLLDLLRDSALPLPPEAARLTVLTPYGARLRYDGVTMEERGKQLDRPWAVACARHTKEWAERLLAKEVDEQEGP